MKKNTAINKVDRSVGVLKQTGSPDSNFVDASPEVLLGFMWELTAEVYSLRGDFDAEQRLQRNVTNLIEP
ncbi:MAG: hypothetical protein K9M75_03900 [Phycisphaerae bacterium]|nr:hypothetical protein [Phycisphaerae bacterium]